MARLTLRTHTNIRNAKPNGQGARGCVKLLKKLIFWNGVAETD